MKNQRDEIYIMNKFTLIKSCSAYNGERSINKLISFKLRFGCRADCVCLDHTNEDTILDTKTPANFESNCSGLKNYSESQFSISSYFSVKKHV